MESIADVTGAMKYPQLVALVKCVLSLSHGNSIPARGFSIDKLLLTVHGYFTYEDTIVALRLVEDELYWVGGEANFTINKELLSDVEVHFPDTRQIVSSAYKLKKLREKNRE